MSGVEHAYWGVSLARTRWYAVIDYCRVVDGVRCAESYAPERPTTVRKFSSSCPKYPRYGYICIYVRRYWFSKYGYTIKRNSIIRLPVFITDAGNRTRLFYKIFDVSLYTANVSFSCVYIRRVRFFFFFL